MENFFIKANPLKRGFNLIDCNDCNDYNDLHLNKKRRLEDDAYNVLLKKKSKTKLPVPAPIIPKQNEKKRKRVESTINSTPNKRFKNDDDLLKVILNDKNKYDNDNDHNSNGINSANNECNNPLCDHKEQVLEFVTNRPLETPKEIKNIDDLIELGKKYHCKKNTSYYGLDLKLLCNLVQPLTKLRNLVGMKTVKENIVNQIVFFVQKFHKKDKCQECFNCLYNLQCTQQTNDDMLHTIITGPPGVGKSELGIILGQVYQKMGILSKGHMYTAKRVDLIGEHVGSTALKTQKFIDKCKGCVMFIDEAYSLGNKEKRDIFSKECIDTINQNMSENRDLLVIIAGYEQDIKDCFLNVNQGLSRRFTFRYDIQPYTSDELMEIFLIKVKREGWFVDFEVYADDSAENVKRKESLNLKCKKFFRDNKKYFKAFGGDVETLFLNCKIIHAKRVLFLDKQHKKILTFDDLEKGFKNFVDQRKYKKDDDNNNDIMSESVKRMYS